MPKTNRPVRHVVVLATLIIAALVLNPSAERHREKIRGGIAERSPIARTFSLGALAAFASTYHSLGIASYTTVGDRVVSYGLFGGVFLAD